MGSKSVSEIMETVPRYLKDNQISELPTASLEETDVPAKVNIPPLSMEYAVLASDYAVVEGVIYHRKTLKIIPDISVERLDLSVRSLNCLIRNGNDQVSSLMGMPFGDFRSIRNLVSFLQMKFKRNLNYIWIKLMTILESMQCQQVQFQPSKFFRLCTATNLNLSIWIRFFKRYQMQRKTM